MMARRYDLLHNAQSAPREIAVDFRVLPRLWHDRLETEFL